MGKGDRVLVTGGAGFLGSHVIDELRNRGYEHLEYPRSKQFDLREQTEVRQMLDQLKPNIVIHLAATVGGIGANQENPGRFLYDNAAMGLILLEESRKHQVKKIVTIGTICSYPKFAPIPFNEDNLWDGYPEETNAPYGLAKKLLLVQSQAYRQQYGLNAIYLMPVNLYGPRDNFDLNSSHVIPAMIRKFVEAKENDLGEVTLWGDGSPTREFLFVAEAARAIVTATEVYDEGDPVNIGSGHEISIRDLAQLIAHELGYSGKIHWDTSKPNGQPRRQLDTQRAKEKFGFQNEIAFTEGVRKTIDWYKKQRTLHSLLSE